MYNWKCPVCESDNTGDTPEFDVCPVCEWEDDHLQRDNPDYSGGANDESLNEARAAWDQKEKDVVAV